MGEVAQRRLPHRVPVVHLPFEDVVSQPRQEVGGVFDSAAGFGAELGERSVRRIERHRDPQTVEWS